MTNKNLKTAQKEKNDEFYTQLSDIEKELIHYKEHLKNKIIYCNCDNPKYSNFWKYFYINFSSLQLKKLIATYYDSNKCSYKTEYDGEKETRTPLIGNGDFRSDECIEILKEADIVVTNPPFSLFHEYIKQLTEYKKHFIIIGSNNAILYKEVFSLMMDKKLWVGYTTPVNFTTPEGDIKPILTKWFTSIEVKNNNKPIKLEKSYTPEEYPKYDNYDAIDINRILDIPKDYFGIMGVQISFLDKYCPEQFDIIGKTGDLELSVTYPFYTPPSEDDKMRYKKANKCWRVQNAYLVINGEAKTKYRRLFIRRKVTDTGADI